MPHDSGLLLVDFNLPRVTVARCDVSEALAARRLARDRVAFLTAIGLAANLAAIVLVGRAEDCTDEVRSFGPGVKVAPDDADPEVVQLGEALLLLGGVAPQPRNVLDHDCVELSRARGRE
ncbi:MAG: hypothetical protein R3E75_08105 [Steroidobacteraceae bacterium]